MKLAQTYAVWRQVRQKEVNLSHDDVSSDLAGDLTDLHLLDANKHLTLSKRNIGEVKKNLHKVQIF